MNYLPLPGSGRRRFLISAVFGGGGSSDRDGSGPQREADARSSASSSFHRGQKGCVRHRWPKFSVVPQPAQSWLNG